MSEMNLGQSLLINIEYPHNDPMMVHNVWISDGNPRFPYVCKICASGDWHKNQNKGIKNGSKKKKGKSINLLDFQKGIGGEQDYYLETPKKVHDTDLRFVEYSTFLVDKTTKATEVISNILSDVEVEVGIKVQQGIPFVTHILIPSRDFCINLLDINPDTITTRVTIVSSLYMEFFPSDIEGCRTEYWDDKKSIHLKDYDCGDLFGAIHIYRRTNFIRRMLNTNIDIEKTSLRKITTEFCEKVLHDDIKKGVKENPFITTDLNKDTIFGGMFIKEESSTKIKNDNKTKLSSSLFGTAIIATKKEDKNYSNFDRKDFMDFTKISKSSKKEAVTPQNWRTEARTTFVAKVKEENC